MNKITIHNIRYAIEFIPLWILLFILSLMSPEIASNFAGSIGRKIGPKLAASRKALANLKMALPGKTDEEYQEIIAGMWDNLARIIAEYQDLELYAPDVELVNVHYLKDALENGQVILFSGHIGNWEIMAPTLLHYQIPLDLVYRAPNNPWVDKALNKMRSLNGKLLTIPKSRTGTRLLVDRVSKGQSIGILIDQKYNEGLAVPFFGQPAMTSPAFVQLAQKYECPLVPFRVERIDKTKFRLSFYKEIQTKDSQNQDIPAETIIAEAHALLESWISERPEQWLWLHRRWVDKSNPGKKAAAKMEKAKKSSKNGQSPIEDHDLPAG